MASRERSLRRCRDSRSDRRRSMVSAVHVNSRTSLRPSSTREPSGPPSEALTTASLGERAARAPTLSPFLRAAAVALLPTSDWTRALSRDAKNAGRPGGSSQAGATLRAHCWFRRAVFGVAAPAMGAHALRADRAHFSLSREPSGRRESVCGLVLLLPTFGWTRALARDAKVTGRPGGSSQAGAALRARYSLVRLQFISAAAGQRRFRFSVPVAGPHRSFGFSFAFSVFPHSAFGRSDFLALSANGRAIVPSSSGVCSDGRAAGR